MSSYPHGWSAVLTNAAVLFGYLIAWVAFAALASGDVPETTMAGKVTKRVFVVLSLAVPFAIFIVASVLTF